jgi:hypothetical protein
MATETSTKLLDDLDGSSADRTVTFVWEGVSYELDLSKKNAGKLSKEIAPYVQAGRKVVVSRRRATAKSRDSKQAKASDSESAGSADPAAVRAWAAQNGFEISARGRISTAVVAAYQAQQ